MEVTWKIDETRRTAELTLATEPPCRMMIDAAGLETVINRLGRLRSELQPPIPPSVPLGRKVMAIVNAGWFTEREAFQGHSLLHLGHPGFGWLHFQFAREQADKLARLLRIQVELPPPGHQKSPH